MERNGSALAVGVVWLVLFAGCSNPYTLVRQTAPAQFHRSDLFALEPVHFDETLIGRYEEGAWLGQRSVAQREKWEADKEAFARRFMGSLVGRATPFHFTVGVPAACGVMAVSANVEAVTPGRLAPFFFRRRTEVQMRVQLSDCGAVYDEFVVNLSVRPSWTRAALGTRMRVAGDEAATLLYRYLLTRTANAG